MKLNYKKLYKREKTINIILTIETIIIFLILIVLFYQLFAPKNYNTKIIFENLNSSEISLCIGLIQDLKPEYLSLARSIKFTKNIINNDEEILGKNVLKGTITIKYTNYNETRMVLGHELLHNILYAYDDEFYTYDIGYTEVCYKKV